MQLAGQALEGNKYLTNALFRPLPVEVGDPPLVGRDQDLVEAAGLVENAASHLEQLRDHLLAGAHGATRDANLEEDKQAVVGWKSAAPDMTIRVERMVAEGDLVAVQWIGTGTNTGEGNGLPATGRKVSARDMTIFRFRDGRIAEEWNTIDMLGVLRQLGLLPDTATDRTP